MSAVSGLLLRLDAKWMVGAGIWDDMAETTAWGLLALANGPGFFFLRLLGPGYPMRLVGVAAFWAWTGFLLDRRLRGSPRPLVHNAWLRAVLHSLGLALSLLLVFGAFSRLHIEARYLGQLPSAFLAYPRKTLLGREIFLLATMLWSSLYLVFFSLKLWHAWGAILDRKRDRAV
jgi:hypothetical protein